ncbi:MAG TPA: stage II sporulation protein M [Chthonomonadaceae bacterium]|nr:stage II sporulation protein M [Chthonomonadaceae bacterium]
MNERQFVDKKRADWDLLSGLIRRASGRGGVRVLNRDEVRELGPLYRRISSDLAYARLHATNRDLIAHLNGLVGRAHALMFEAERPRSAGQSIVHFYVHEFPAVLQRRVGYFLTAILIAAVGFIFAYWLVITHPDKSDLFIPGADLREAAKAWQAGKVVDPGHIAQAGMLMTHNQTVGMFAFGSGPALGIPSAYMMYSTGTMLGAFSALMTQAHAHKTFWPGILPHGFAELTAIFICGAAGMLIGMSLLFPGRYTRVESLKRGGRDAIKLMLGTVPLFIFAGIIEGTFSHLPLPGWVRLAFAGINGVIWYLYLFLPRPPGSIVDSDADPA